jgi:hypothetical protein
MKKSSTVNRILLGIGMVASTSVAFAATSSFALDAISNYSAGNQTFAMLLAGLGLMGTIARRRQGNRG